jgi:hypothetical protein
VEENSAKLDLSNKFTIVEYATVDGFSGDFHEKVELEFETSVADGVWNWRLIGYDMGKVHGEGFSTEEEMIADAHRFTRVWAGKLGDEWQQEYDNRRAK